MAAIGARATTDGAKLCAIARAAGLPSGATNDVLGQVIATLSSCREKRMMRAKAMYGSPGVTPKPPKPLAGSELWMKSVSNCAFESSM